MSGANARLMKTVEGQGMPRLRNPFEFGNLFLMLNIEFPAAGALTPAAQAALLEAMQERLRDALANPNSSFAGAFPVCSTQAPSLDIADEELDRISDLLEPWADL